MSSILKGMMNDNSELMSKLFKEDRVDLGDGLSCSMSYGTMNDYELINFEFFLEGVRVGDLDGELGGCVRGCKENDFRLMDSIIERMYESFPSLKTQG